MTSRQTVIHFNHSKSLLSDLSSIQTDHWSPTVMGTIPVGKFLLGHDFYKNFSRNMTVLILLYLIRRLRMMKDVPILTTFF